MCILFVYTLLKVVSYYDLSVLSVSVMGLQNKFGCDVSKFWIFGFFFKFCKAPL